ELLGERLGEPYDPRLGRRVVGHAGEADLAEPGGDVDDRPFSPLDHRRHHLAGAEEGAGQVDVDHALPFLHGHLEERRLGHDAGVVHEGIDPPEMLHHRPHHPGDLVGVADVGLERRRLPPQAQDGCDRALRSFPVLHVADGHVGARPGASHGDGGADAAAGAGHEHDLSVQRVLEHGGCHWPSTSTNSSAGSTASEITPASKRKSCVAVHLSRFWLSISSPMKSKAPWSMASCTSGACSVSGAASYSAWSAASGSAWAASKPWRTPSTKHRTASGFSAM